MSTSMVLHMPSSTAMLGNHRPAQPRQLHQMPSYQTLARTWRRPHAAAHVSAGMSNKPVSQEKDAPDKQQGGPDISLLSPRVQGLWDHARNVHLGNIAIKPYSHRHAYFVCTNCPDGHSHRWRARIASVTRNSGCPFCSGHDVCPHNSLPCKAPHLVSEWDTAANSDSPQDYTVRSGHRPYWRCSSGHQWQTRIYARVRGNTGCPICVKARPRQKLPTLTDSTSQVMEFWDRKHNQVAGLDPHKLTCGSHMKAHFVCKHCPKLQSHKWKATIFGVVRGTGCPYCSSQKVCKCNSLQTLRPELATQWCHAKNKGTPSDYTSRSKEVVWWETAERGQWQASIATRTQMPPKA